MAPLGLMPQGEQRPMARSGLTHTPKPPSFPR